MQGAPIGVFDSGVGGLSVLREIRHALPEEDLLYVADSGHAPYGNRPGKFITDRAEAIVEFFLNEGVKAVVVACNTVTTVAILTLRSRFTIPIVAIEPAVKPAAQLTRSGVIGVLATSQTLASESFSRLAEKYGMGVQILEQPCPGLVELVEKAELNGPRTEALIVRYVSPLLEQGADTIVLGCTHFPFLISTIRAVAGPNVAVLDPAVAVARELHRRLKASELLASKANGSTEQFWTSGSLIRVQPVIAKLWGENVPIRSLPSAFCAL
ncbi:glutamate racemase [uncultured Desulfosarcina sp.]|uniref:glutamate racemase n=1 Tax=uncultured Desulfosarcina sp. TaxID=218289 RepID=UPI0029C6AA94|nr:glutamate racemase [uncultured Desulfosarcina sp.]